jgi:cytochrome c553
MRIPLGISVLAIAVATFVGQPLDAQEGGNGGPWWAYGYLTAPKPGEASRDCPPAGGRPVDCANPRPPANLDETPHSLPGASRQFSRKQISEWFGPADWYPEDHPAMPEIVAKGNEKTGVRACSLCHMPNGKGRSENAAVSGLPVNYFIQTMEQFAKGERKSADPRKLNTKEMAAMAKAMTPAEIRAAAEYFGSMKWTPYVKVVETDTPPGYQATPSGMFHPTGKDSMPLGKRIIEVPAELERTEALRDPRSGWIAYAPVGSIAQGEALATTGGNGKTIACNICHGPDLMGLGDVPGIGGRTASYIGRQLYDMQQGTRKTALMKAVVAKLTEDDFIALAAYVASRPVN